MASETRLVLVVEDDVITREGIAAVLRREGYTVEMAEDGQEALSYLRRSPPPGLILLDMLLPVRDGWAFLKERRQEPDLAHIPVYIMTALGVAGPEWASSLGAAGFLGKPIEVEALLAAVRRHCSLTPSRPPA